MSSSKNSTANTPPDSAFHKQTDLARGALRAFAAIIHLNLNMPGPIKSAMEELVNTTVSPSHSRYFSKFTDFENFSFLSMTFCPAICLIRSFKNCLRRPTLPSPITPTKIRTSSLPTTSCASTASSPGSKTPKVARLKRVCPPFLYCFLGL
jgi:hypothetical protein